MRSDGEVRPSGPRARRRVRLPSALIASLASPLLLAFAQPPATPPTRDEVRRPVAPRTDEERSRLEVEGELERAPCALDRPEHASIRFTPTGADFENLRGLPSERLRPAYAPFLGTEQPLSVICDIRDRAAALLREAGYIAAIEVPEQRIEGGRLRFRVLMARLVALRVRGDAGRNERLIARYLEPLTGQDVFNARDAERYLLLASDLPGYNVRLALRPAGTAPGEVVGDVTVVRLPGQLDFNVQNYGSEAVGRGGLLLRGQLFGLTGMGDRTILALYSTADLEDQQTIQAAHDFRLGGEGLQVGGQITYSWARPQLGAVGFDIRSRTLFATLEAHYPLIRSQLLSLRVGGGVDLVDQRVEISGLPLSDEKLRILFARAAFDASSAPRQGLDPRWRLEGSAELRRGLRAFGASRGCNADFSDCTAAGLVPPSRLEGNPAATVVRAAVSGEFRPAAELGFFLGFSAQHGSSPLFAFEEYSAGNYTVGRGYDPATIVGDRGVGLQAEVRFWRLAPQSPLDLALQPYIFFDSAWVRNEDRFFLAGGSDDLQSAGAGVRGLLGDRVQFDVALAVPLSRAGFLTERPDPRLLISLTTRLWPGSLR